MGVTIKEIARKVGVTAATVSRALNGKPGVSATLRKRIEGVAEKMGYAPDLHARALVTGHVPFLALVVPDITNPYYPALARGAEEEAFQAGYSLLLVNTDWREERLRQALDLLRSRRVAGLALAAPVERLDSVKPYDWASLTGALVLIGRRTPEGTAFPSLELNNQRGGYLIGAHVAASSSSSTSSLSGRRIAYLGGEEGDRPTVERLAGFRQALTEAGLADRLLDTSFGPWTYGPWTVESGQERARMLFEAVPNLDTVFAANDLLAVGVARAAAERGRVVGRDLALIGYDDIPGSRYHAPPLSTVAQPTAEMGRLAVRVLLAQIEERALPETLALEPRLVCRESCGGDASNTKERNQT
jgi:LacI family transcriptional regulator, galactose operon repressor